MKTFSKRHRISINPDRSTEVRENAEEWCRSYCWIPHARRTGPDSVEPKLDVDAQRTERPAPIHPIAAVSATQKKNRKEEGCECNLQELKQQARLLADGHAAVPTDFLPPLWTRSAEQSSCTYHHAWCLPYPFRRNGHSGLGTPTSSSNRSTLRHTASAYNAPSVQSMFPNYVLVR